MDDGGRERVQHGAARGAAGGSASRVDERMLTDRHADLAAGRFGLGEGATLSGPMARGLQGLVWRLQTSGGVFALKELLIRVEEEPMRVNADFTAAAVAEGVAAPVSVPTTDGGLLAELDGAQVRVYEWVDLREPDIGLDPTVIGRTVAAIHRAGVPTTGDVEPWYAEPVGELAWRELVGAVGRAGAPFAPALAAMLDEILALEALIRPPVDLRVRHRDLWADNLRVAADGRVCVIDWDDAGPAGPSHEVAMVLSEFCTGLDGRVDAQRARALHESYVSVGGPGRVTDAGDFSMVIAVTGHITAKHLGNWVSGEPGERRGSEAGIAEFLERALTREAIDALVAAVQD